MTGYFENVLFGSEGQLIHISARVKVLHAVGPERLYFVSSKYTMKMQVKKQVMAKSLSFLN